MAEQIILHDQNDYNITKHVERKEYYKNKVSKYSERRVGVVDTFIFNTKGEITLQQRGKNASSSPLLVHTSV